MALVKADGTAIAKSPGSSVLQSVTEQDPKIRVLVPVYEDTAYSNVKFPTQERQLAFHAGQVIRQSEWDAKFQAPTVASISPLSGPAAGGTPIVITGSRFTPSTTVTIGGTAATNIVIEGGTRLTCKTPAGDAGAADVVVTTGGGTVTKTNGFTYS